MTGPFCRGIVAAHATSSRREGALTPAGGTLRRDLGLLDAIGIGYGAIVGAGIFVVTGVAAGIAGPALLLGLAIAGVAATANALSSAQLAAAYPRAGATYEYGCRLLHPWAGFTAGWMFLASKIAAAGTVAIGLAGYVAVLSPGVPPRAIAVGAILVFTALNYVGIRRSSRVNLLIVSGSLGALVLFVLAGATSFQASRLAPFAPGGWRGTLEAAALLFFAYTGYARIATLAEEVRDPARVIPLAVVITIGSAIVLYAAVAVVALGAVGAETLAGTTAPLHAAARAFAPPLVAAIVAAGGLMAMLGVILTQLLGLSRTAFAMARGGDLPAPLARLHPRYGVPGRAVVVIGAIAALVAATGTLRGVAASAAFAILVYYGIANVAALRMPREARRYPDAVPAIGLAACTLLALSLPAATILSGLGLLAAGIVVRIVVRHRAQTAGGAGTPPDIDTRRR